MTNCSGMCQRQITDKFQRAPHERSPRNRGT